MMLYEDYSDGIRSAAAMAGVLCLKASRRLYDGVYYDPLCLLNKAGSNPDVLITAGFHGEEPAGSMTILRRMGEIFDYAAVSGICLRVLPCINPTGFEDGRRYNRSGERPNNWFLEYEVGGKWVGELPPGQAFRRFRDRGSFGGPEETSFVLSPYGFPRRAVLDLHQDQEIQTGTYAYVFGDRVGYRKIMSRTAKYAGILSNHTVDRDWYGEIITDNDGLVEFSDGSITDYYWRNGVDVSVTVETAVAMPLETSIAINMEWIRSIIDMAAEAKHATP